MKTNVILFLFQVRKLLSTHCGRLAIGKQAHSGKEGQFRVINATAHINYLVKNLVKKWREGETSLTKASFKKGLNLFKVSYHIAWRFDQISTNLRSPKMFSIFFPPQRTETNQVLLSTYVRQSRRQSLLNLERLLFFLSQNFTTV